jgi:CheY-like chemotaxis protein
MKKTILVVDDFTSIRTSLCETLERKGYATIGVGNGSEALKVLEEKAIDITLVLSDCNVSPCSSFELLKKIKENQTTSSIPVIFLTAELSPEKINAAKEAGLTAWIKKPYRSETFFAQIENTLSNEQ